MQVSIQIRQRQEMQQVNTKLHINLSQGIIDIEGDPELAREIYSDFKEQLLNLTQSNSTPNTEDLPKPTDNSNDGNKTKQRPKPKRRSASKKKTSEEERSSVLADAPQLDKHLDTSGLPKYYEQFEPKNHPEKILIFLKFMTQNLGIENPNTDQFYTCYEKMDERIPKVFSQAFRDASGRKFGFIDYNSPTDIQVTTSGTNHFKFDLKKKEGIE